MTYRDFTITGRVYSGNESHAKHLVYWAIRNSETEEDVIIHSVTIENGETK